MKTTFFQWIAWIPTAPATASAWPASVTAIAGGEGPSAKRRTKGSAVACPTAPAAAPLTCPAAFAAAAPAGPASDAIGDSVTSTAEQKDGESGSAFHHFGGNMQTSFRVHRSSIECVNRGWSAIYLHRHRRRRRRRRRRRPRIGLFNRDDVGGKFSFPKEILPRLVEGEGKTGRGDFTGPFHRVIKQTRVNEGCIL